MTALPAAATDYWERVYAGVLGKVIGVYLGRPFENWSHERIAEQLGDINSYVHERLGVPLIVTDDDITGTFTFIRAFDDYGCSDAVTAAQIGHTWLNYLIEDETILWWGGMGNSTEHTAYLRLKSGVKAPDSGSIALNGQVVAEQIGSQIFIDGWGLVTPGNPALAADLARRAASVSHDGEAIFGAQVIAAMVAQAFIDHDVDAVIDAGLAVIPDDSVIHRMVGRIRGWRAEETDWRVARDLLDAEFGYGVYGGNCHIVPNHGLIMLALLYGDGSFQKSMMIVNTAGWDTDCNSGNLGCLLGVMLGLAGLDAGVALGGTDFRGPVADRMYLPTADGGRAITDALTESVHLANMGRRFAGLGPLAPKGGARFHFELPGSVQGFAADPESGASVDVRNVEGFSRLGTRSLAIRSRPFRSAVLRVETPTFIPSREVGDYFDQPGYRLMASPTLHSGQVLTASLTADAGNEAPVNVSLFVKHYDADDNLAVVIGDTHPLPPGGSLDLRWTVPDTDGQPIAMVGIAVGSPAWRARGSNGEPTGEANGEPDEVSATVYLDALGWSGPPVTSLNRPIARTLKIQRHGSGPMMWRKAWVDGLDARQKIAERDGWPEPYRLIQNNGRGLLMQGGREWLDYGVEVEMTPHMCRAAGLAVRVQGLERYYALVCSGEGMKLIRRFEGTDTTLAGSPHVWRMGETVRLALSVVGDTITASLDGVELMRAIDPGQTFNGGGIGLLVEEGRVACHCVRLSGAERD